MAPQYSLSCIHLCYCSFKKNYVASKVNSNDANGVSVGHAFEIIDADGKTAHGNAGCTVAGQLRFSKVYEFMQHLIAKSLYLSIGL